MLCAHTLATYTIGTSSRSIHVEQIAIIIIIHLRLLSFKDTETSSSASYVVELGTAQPGLLSKCIRYDSLQICL